MRKLEYPERWVTFYEARMLKALHVGIAAFWFKDFVGFYKRLSTACG